MSEQRSFVPSGGDLMGMGAKIRIIFLFLSYWKNNASFQNFIWRPLRAPPISLGVRGLFGRLNSRFKNTGMIRSNLEQIYSRSVLWWILLPHRMILTLDFLCWVWWIWGSSRVPWTVMGSSPLIEIIIFIRENSCIKKWNGRKIKFTWNQVDQVRMMNNTFMIFLKD